MPDEPQYQSPFSWRYASKEMRQVWSEENKHLLWRKMWVALAEVQSKYHLVTSEQLADIQFHQNEIDLKNTLEVESEIHHDLMAELKVFARQSLIGGGVLHMGATSTDIEDNVDALRIRQSIEIILKQMALILGRIAVLLDEWADVPVMGFTHLQPAEPTTLGYRLAFTGQDLVEAFIEGRSLSVQIRGKGFKGAVGTAAAFSELVGEENLIEFDKELSKAIQLPFYAVTNQTSPRRQEYHIASWLAGCAGSLHKLAFDLRLLQSPIAGEIMEPFSDKQVGSSAMPFKRNPINSEKINSLARFIAQMPRVAWDNYANSLLERTLDDSANRRLILPEAFLAMDEILITVQHILQGLNVDHQAIQTNLDRYASFAATERVLLELTRRGANRLEAHEVLRQLSLQAWQTLQKGEANPLDSLICNNPFILRFIRLVEISPLLDVHGHIGIAAQRSCQLASRIRQEIEGFGPN